MPGNPTLFGIDLSPLTLSEIVTSLRHRPSSDVALPLFTLNVAHVVSLRRDAAFRAAYRAAWLVTVDGAPIHACARLKGLAVGKVAGSDLVAAIFASPPAEGMRPFFVASSQATARSIRSRLAMQGFGEDALAFDIPPFGFHRDGAYSAALADRIRAHGTTHLFMGVGAPKSEIWVVERKAELGGCFALCVGAGLDYLAGTRRRAPALLQKTGFEWAWRLWSEPRRLAGRYLGDAFAFAYIVAFGGLDVRERDTGAP